MRRAVFMPLATVVTLALGGLPIQGAPHCKPCSVYLPSDLDQDGGGDCAKFEAVATEETSESFENLVFQGGGVKGVAYAGALVAFGDERLAKVENIAGTSVGAITALTLALGYDTEQLCKIGLHTDFEGLRDGGFPGDMVRLLENFGWYKGEKALCMLQCLIEHQTGSKETTFAELHELQKKDPKFKDLYVFGTNLNSHESVAFSHRGYGNLTLAKAVRTSMAIPFFFAAEEIDGHLFVDGALLRNYPIEFFDDLAQQEGKESTLSTLGFHLGAEPRPSSVGNLIKFSEEIVLTLLSQQTDHTCHTPHDIQRSVFIDTGDIRATEFSINREQRLHLIEQGRKATVKYLTEAEHPSCCPEFVSASLSKECSEGR